MKNDTMESMMKLKSLLNSSSHPIHANDILYVNIDEVNQTVYYFIFGEVFHIKTIQHGFLKISLK